MALELAGVAASSLGSLPLMKSGDRRPGGAGVKNRLGEAQLWLPANHDVLIGAEEVVSSGAEPI